MAVLTDQAILNRNSELPHRSLAVIQGGHAFDDLAAVCTDHSPPRETSVRRAEVFYMNDVIGPTWTDASVVLAERCPDPFVFE